METFLILLAVIFVPFVWFIRRMLRFTDETIGDDSLLYGLETSPNRIRTYQFSASDYFSTTVKVMYAFLFVQMFVMAFVVVKAAPQQDAMLRLFLWFTVLLCLAFAGYLAYSFYVDWRFWNITRNVSITFDPYTPSIKIDGPTESGFFTPDTLSRVEQHTLKIDNSRHPLYGYGCSCLYGTDGEVVWINNIFFGGFGGGGFLERFFPHVPVATVWQKFPGTSMISEIENRQTAEL